MSEYTFGFMDPDRDSEANISLFSLLRKVAVDAFLSEKVCDLSLFAEKSMEDWNQGLYLGHGERAGVIRDLLVEYLEKSGRTKIDLPDVQSVFLYAFTAGINDCMISFYDLEEIDSVRSVPMEQVLQRRFPIRGPEWVCTAGNIEMSSVENVFVAMQDKIIIPSGERGASARDLSDVLAGTFLWSYLAGGIWFYETTHHIRKCVDSEGLMFESSDVLNFQLKKTLLPIPAEELKRILMHGDFIASQSDKSVTH